MTTTVTGIESEAEVAQFAERLLDLYTGALLSAMIDVGHRTGLFEAAALGEVTSEELADRAGLQERYVREWLGSMVTSGIIDYHPAGRTYRLPAAHAACLTGPGAGNLAPLSRLDTHLTEHVGEVARAFREGGGVPFAAYQPDFTDVMDAAGRGGYDADLVDSWLPLAPGLSETLAAGARVADVACGTGHALLRARTARSRGPRSSATTARQRRSPARGRRPPLPGWPTSTSRWPTSPGCVSMRRSTRSSSSTPSTTRPHPRPCWTASSVAWCRVAGSS